MKKKRKPLNTYLESLCLLLKLVIKCLRSYFTFQTLETVWCQMDTIWVWIRFQRNTLAAVLRIQRSKFTQEGQVRGQCNDPGKGRWALKSGVALWVVRGNLTRDRIWRQNHPSLRADCTSGGWVIKDDTRYFGPRNWTGGFTLLGGRVDCGEADLWDGGED